MPHVRFTRNIQRHVACPPADVSGETVAAALDAYFEQHPRARGYVLDEQGALRKHMVIFRDGVQITDRRTLADVITPDSTLDVMQALSGG